MNKALLLGNRLMLRLKKPWIRTVLYLCIGIVVPEYFTPVFLILSFVAAMREARLSHGSQTGGVHLGTMAEPLALIFIFMCIGLFYSRDVLSTAGSILLWLGVILVYIALVTVITSRRRLEMTIFAVTVAVAANGIIAGFQFLFGSALGFELDMAFWKSFDNAFLGLFNTALPYYDGDRAASTFCNPNVFAQSMGMLLPFALYFACSHRKDLRHNLCRVLVPLAFFGTLFSFSRGVYLALIIILLMYGFYHIKKLRFILIAAVIIILLIPSSVYSRFLSLDSIGEFLSGVINNFPQQSIDYEGSLLDSIMNYFEAALTKGAVEESTRLRFDAWISTMRLILKNPMEGYGAGYNNIKLIINEAGIPIFHTHNFYFQTLMEGGIILLLLHVWIHLSTFRKGMMLIRHSSAPKMGLSIECFIIGFAVMGLTDIPILTIKGMFSFAIAIGMTEAAANLYYQRHPLSPSEAFFTVTRIGKLISKIKKPSLNTREREKLEERTTPESTK